MRISASASVCFWTGVLASLAVHLRLSTVTLNPYLCHAPCQVKRFRMGTRFLGPQGFLFFVKGMGRRHGSPGESRGLGEGRRGRLSTVVQAGKDGGPENR